MINLKVRIIIITFYHDSGQCPAILENNISFLIFLHMVEIASKRWPKFFWSFHSIMLTSRQVRIRQTLIKFCH